jgi:uncharacterized protein YndB with AHSA1/START domain
MTDQPALNSTLDRTLLIRAHPEVVFRFFTDSQRWAAWWGVGSSIDPQPGGRVLIRYPDGTEATGNVVEIIRPERLVFTYGYAKGTPVAPGASLVTIELEPHHGGTRLRLCHAFADPGVRDEHTQGWRYQLSLFANAVADDLHAGADGLVDRWFAAWSEPDDAIRETTLRSIAAADIGMRDRFSAIDGIDDLLAHLKAVQVFMPGMKIVRQGNVCHCQGSVLAEWFVTRDGGEQFASGTNVFVIDGDRRLRSVTGFWKEPRRP